jgi:hypothetical protein
MLGGANAAWRSDAFKPHRYVDAISENVTIFDDNVANIDADTKLNPMNTTSWLQFWLRQSTASPRAPR